MIGRFSAHAAECGKPAPILRSRRGRDRMLVPLCMNAGRTPEAIEWALRAARAGAAPAALHRRALGMLALAFDGRAVKLGGCGAGKRTAAAPV
jgi:hypothetical protein